MERFTIKLRLYSLVGVLVIITVGIGTFGMISTHNIIAHLQHDAHKEQEFAHTLELAEVTEIEFKSQVIEWKNILLRSSNKAKYKLHKKRYDHSVETVKHEFSELEKKYKKLELDTTEVEEVREKYLKLNETYGAAFSKINSNNPNSGKIVDQLVKDIDIPVAKAFEKMAHHLSEEIDALVKQSDAYAAEVESSTTITDIILIVLGAIIGIIYGQVIIKSIINPVNKLIEVTESLAKGDMTVSIEVKGKSEISQLQQSLSTMNNKLGSVLKKVSLGADSVRTSADEISGGNIDLSSRTEEQAASIEETSSSMEQITEKVKENSDSALQAVGLSNTATEKAEQGLSVAHSAVTAINEIKDSSEKVADIISVIDEIAFQTNLLALNASIEAERAGEQGRGFSVVANEVQKLAQRSADAASEIKALIKTSSARVIEGTELVKSSSTSLEEIVKTSSETNDVMNTISAASQEQSSSLSQVNVAITQMEQTTQQNAALVEETSAASLSMSDQATQLNKLVAFFKLDNNPSIDQEEDKTNNVSSSSSNKKKKSNASGTKSTKNGSDEWNEF